MTSGCTTLIPFQWQNPLPTDQLNSHRQAHKSKSQTQHKTWVIPHAGHLEQTRGRQGINMAPQRSQCQTGNMSGSTAVTREQDDNVLCLPQWLSQSAQRYFRLLSRAQIALVGSAWDSLFVARVVVQSPDTK